MLGGLAFPVDIHHPPTRPIIEELGAIDATSKRLLALGVTRLVSAPYVRDVVPLLDAVGDRRLEEAFLSKIRLRALDVFIGSEEPPNDRFIRITSPNAGSIISGRTRRRSRSAWAGELRHYVI